MQIIIKKNEWTKPRKFHTFIDLYDSMSQYEEEIVLNQWLTIISSCILPKST